MILTALVITIGGLICAGLVKIALMYWNEYNILLRSKCFRGPKGYPFIGIAHLFLGNNTADIFNIIKEITSNYESPFRVWLGPRLLFGIHDPEHVKQLLTSPDALEKNSIYDLYKPVLGHGLITAPASMWKRHRKAIQPTFNMSILETYIPVFIKNASIVAKKLETQNEFDAYGLMSRYSLDSICETTMGVCINSLTTEDCRYLESIDSLGEIIYMRIVKIWLFNDFIFKFTPTGKKLYDSAKYTRDIANNVLMKAREDLEKDTEKQRRKSFLNLLVSSTEGGFKFTDQEIHDEVATMMAAGYETTANLLSFTMLMLSSYPEVQDKLYAEMREIYGDCEAENLEFTLQNINRMEYFDRVIKETMRLFPVSAVLGRTASNDVKIGGYTMPAGSTVLMVLSELHRNEKYWPEPLEFIPERFLPNHPMGPSHPYAFIPFSGGPRNCIGIKYASISLKIVLTSLLWSYKIKTNTKRRAKDVELKVNSTLKPKDPIMISVERRHCPTS